MLNATRPKNRTIFLYLMIPVAMFIFTVFVPLVTALVYSFYEWKGGPNKTFSGLDNYIRLINDSTFWEAFGHNIYLVAACIIGQVGIAFVLVMMVNSKLVKFKTIHRTFGFFPSTISAVCIGMIWTMVYHNKYGILNWFLKAIGRSDLTQVWLNNSDLVMLLVSIPLIWQFIGYYMVIILSAISGISTDIFESAEIDGANGVQQALHITLPLIKNTMLVCITLCIAGNMKAFDSIYVMTSGGPGTSSMVMAMYGYQVSFGQSNMGYGSCISVGIFVLSLLVIGGSQGLINRLTRGKGED
ncbi:MAG: sugar ABC transporter permease [Lachnospiraceae bacterium]|nr:sugar ABC transporter permease [Clostridiales bacterium]MCC8080493.1 sugar ABC transporter permease [Lachnospiraceae bacterium]